MESQLRLAERRGVLTGRFLHLVQEYALEMLMLIDSREKAQSFVDNIRASLVAGDISKLPTIFPEWYDKDEEEPDLDHPETITWSVPETPEEIAFIEEFVRTHAAGTISADELETGGEWE